MNFDKNEMESRMLNPTHAFKETNLCFNSNKNCKLKVNLWWVGACERKKEYIFVTFILLFNISKSISSYSFLLVFKFVESLQSIRKLKSAQNGVMDFNYFLLWKVNRFINKVIEDHMRVIVWYYVSIISDRFFFRSVKTHHIFQSNGNRNVVGLIRHFSCFHLGRYDKMIKIVYYFIHINFPIKSVDSCSMLKRGQHDIFRKIY